MFNHDDDCDKINYEGGICTCGASAPRGIQQESALMMDRADVNEFEAAAVASNERATEDYAGPEQGY